MIYFSQVITSYQENNQTAYGVLNVNNWSHKNA